MRLRFLLLPILLCAASPCFALSPQAADFIRSIGVNPADAVVVAADTDGTIKTTYRGDPVAHSLEELAAGKKTNAVKSFIYTRQLIRQLKTDFAGYKLAIPSPNYDSLYLTEDERALAGRKVAEEFAKKMKK